ncbi:MAG: GNAT family N-acetyltransferase [Acidimicrobiales bacterium]
MVESENGPVTERLEVRPPTEADRLRFVELFCDEDFMVFYGVMSEVKANAWFDRMLALCARTTFAKQPIVERSTGVVIGYTGVDWIEFEERRWLEWGYRLTSEARGKGYATEASSALLDVAAREYKGEILGIIHPENLPSHNVIRKLGFDYWKQAPVEGELRDLYHLRV